MVEIFYKKIMSGIYEVYFKRKKHGTVVRQRHAWCFVPTFGRYVYFGNSRDEAIRPHFDFKAFCEYKEKKQDQ